MSQRIPVLVEKRVPVGVTQGIKMVVTQGIEMQGITVHYHTMMISAAICDGGFIGSQTGKRCGIFLAGVNCCQHK